MNSKNVKICKELVKRFGDDYVIDKLSEEAQEVALAITQLRCKTKTDKKKRLNDVYLEVADLKIALRQAECVLSKRKINKFVNAKLQKKKLKHLTKK